MIEKECKDASRGCVACKTEFFGHLLEYLEPIQDRRAKIIENPEKLDKILNNGAVKAREIASKVLADAKKAMGLTI